MNWIINGIGKTFGATLRPSRRMKPRGSPARKSSRLAARRAAVKSPKLTTRAPLVETVPVRAPRRYEPWVTHDKRQMDETEKQLITNTVKRRRIEKEPENVAPVQADQPPAETETRPVEETPVTEPVEPNTKKTNRRAVPCHSPIQRKAAVRRTRNQNKKASPIKTANTSNDNLSNNNQENIEPEDTNNVTKGKRKGKKSADKPKPKKTRVKNAKKAKANEQKNNETDINMIDNNQEARDTINENTNETNNNIDENNKNNDIVDSNTANNNDENMSNANKNVEENTKDTSDDIEPTPNKTINNDDESSSEKNSKIDVNTKKANNNDDQSTSEQNKNIDANSNKTNENDVQITSEKNKNIDSNTTDTNNNTTTNPTDASNAPKRESIWDRIDNFLSPEEKALCKTLNVPESHLEKRKRMKHWEKNPTDKLKIDPQWIEKHPELEWRHREVAIAWARMMCAKFRLPHKGLSHAIRFIDMYMSNTENMAFNGLMIATAIALEQVFQSEETPMHSLPHSMLCRELAKYFSPTGHFSMETFKEILLIFHNAKSEFYGANGFDFDLMSPIDWLDQFFECGKCAFPKIFTGKHSWQLDSVSYMRALQFIMKMEDEHFFIGVPHSRKAALAFYMTFIHILSEKTLYHMTFHHWGSFSDVEITWMEEVMAGIHNKEMIKVVGGSVIEDRIYLPIHDPAASLLMTENKT